MTSPRNGGNPHNRPGPDAAERLEGMLKNFDSLVEEEHPDYEALMFSISRIQRLALVAIADPKPTTAMVAPGVESKPLRSLQQTQLARRALDAVETLESMIRNGRRDPSHHPLTEPTPRQS